MTRSRRQSRNWRVLKAIGNDGKYFGEFTLSVVLYDKDPRKIEEAIPEFQKVFTSHDGLLYESDTTC